MKDKHRCPYCGQSKYEHEPTCHRFDCYKAHVELMESDLERITRQHSLVSEKTEKGPEN